MNDDNASNKEVVLNEGSNSGISPIRDSGYSKKRNILKKVKQLLGRNLFVTVIVIVFTLSALVVLFVYIKNSSKIQTLSSNNQVVNEYRRKLTDLRKVVEKDSDSSSAHKNYAIALYVTKNYDSAIKEYEAALKIDADDSVTYNNLGNAYRDVKNYDKAIECYKVAIEKDPELVNAYINLANVQLYSKKDSNAAIATYGVALEALPNNSQIELLLGSTYEYLGKANEARRIYENILAHDSDNVAAKSNLERMDKN